MGGSHRVSEEEKATGENEIRTLKDRGIGWSSMWLLKSPRIFVAKDNVSQSAKIFRKLMGEINIFRKEGRWYS